MKKEQYQSAVDNHITACDQAMAESELTETDYEQPMTSLAALAGYVDKLIRRSDLLRQHMPVAKMKTDAARHALGQARLAEKAIQNVLQIRDQVEVAAYEHKAQLSLDEIGRIIAIAPPKRR